MHRSFQISLGDDLFLFVISSWAGPACSKCTNFPHSRENNPVNIVYCRIPCEDYVEAAVKQAIMLVHILGGPTYAVCAGRTGPGACYRLYAENAFLDKLLPFPVLEIQKDMPKQCCLVAQISQRGEHAGFSIHGCFLTR